MKGQGDNEGTWAMQGLGQGRERREGGIGDMEGQGIERQEQRWNRGNVEANEGIGAREGQG